MRSRCGEEAADAGEGAVAVFDEALLRGGEVVPGDVGGDACGFGGALHLAVVGAVLGGGPGGDGAFVEGLGLVGDDEVGVEVDGVAEALAAGAGAEGIVEGEEARLGLAVGAVAGGALEGGGEAELRWLSSSWLARDGVELNFAGLAVAGLDGVDEAGADLGAEGEAVDEDEDGLGEVEFEERLGGGELDDVAVLIGRGGCSRGGGAR